MLSRAVAVVSLSSVFAAGCTVSTAEAPEKAEVSVANASTPLTEKAKDALFTLTLNRAPRSYPIADIMVDVAEPGQTATAVEFTLADVNENGQLDPGESLACAEPPLNLFDQSLAGKRLTVDFAVRQSNGVLLQIGTASWTPQ